MKTLILDGTAISLQAALTTSAATTNPTFVTNYADNSGSGITEGATDGALNGSTDVSIVPAPTGSNRRVIKNITIYNGDTAAVTVLIKYDNNATQRTLVKVTLAVGDTWTTEGVFDTNGSLKQTVGSVNLTSGVTGTLPIANGGTSATSAGAARTALGLTIGTDVQAFDAQLTDVAGLTPTDNNFIVGNGTNFVTESGATARTSLGVGSIATQDSSNVTITGGSITGITALPVASGGTGVTASTGTVAVVLSTSPTLVTPILGTPTSGTLTSCTGLPLTTGVTGTLAVANGGTGITSLGSGVATWLGTPSSSNLASAVTDETGSGALVFATSPTLVTPVLGTPSSGNLNSCTADGTNKVGYRNIPPVGTKTGSYTLATGDVGEYVQVGSGGSITIPNSTFAEGDIITIFNNTTGNITITCTITTAYIAGTNTDKDSMTLATRGLATILFISGTVCVISGNVT
jgi:hypothetical protein